MRTSRDLMIDRAAQVAHDAVLDVLEDRRRRGRPEATIAAEPGSLAEIALAFDIKQAVARRLRQSLDAIPAS